MNYIIDKRLKYANHCKIVKKDGSGWITEKSPVTRENVIAHFNNGAKYGVPFIKPGDHVIITAMVDLDDHDGDVGWPGMQAVARNVCDALTEVNLIANPYRSNGGKGINLWLGFPEDQPQDAYSVRMLIKDALKVAGFNEGSRGVASGEIEIFPKQDSVALDENGNCAALPRAPLSHLTFDDCDHYEWRDSQTVTVLEKPNYECNTHNSTMQLDKVQIDQLLSHVDPSGMDYSQWNQVLMAIHAAGGTLDQAQQWSRRDPFYREETIPESKWQSYKGEGRMVTAKTLMMLANEGGWDGFDVDVDAFPEALGEVKYVHSVVKGGDHAHKILSTIEQVVKCTTSDSNYPYKYSHDLFLGQLLVNNQVLGDGHYTAARTWFGCNNWQPVSKDMMRDVIYATSRTNESDIALTWVNSLKWDGVDRLGGLVEAMGVTSNAYTIAVMKYLLTAVINRQIEPGAQVDMIPILVGGQGVKKSSVAMALAPLINGGMTCGEATLGDLIDTDRAARLVRGKMIVVLDELRGMKRQRDAIKNALTRRWEEHTPKYLEHREVFARRCVLIGTTNEDEFLDDPTGARRYLPMRIDRQIDVDWVKSNLEQLWSQGKSLFENHGQMWQDAERLAKDEHIKYEMGNVLDETIEDYLTTCLDEYVTAADIIIQAGIKNKVGDITRNDEMQVTHLLKRKGYRRSRPMINGVKKWRWKLPG